LAYPDALSTLAEVAIAIAGFSGIVSVFGRRSLGQWSAAERTRLLGLLIISFTALLFCVVPFVLLSIPIPESTCWRSLSLLLGVTRLGHIALLLRVNIAERRIPLGEREVSVVLSAAFVTGDLVAFVALLANAFAWGVVWPYLAAIIWLLTEAAAIFTRLVLVPTLRGPPSKAMKSDVE